MHKLNFKGEGYLNKTMAFLWKFRKTFLVISDIYVHFKHPKMRISTTYFNIVLYILTCKNGYHKQAYQILHTVGKL